MRQIAEPGVATRPPCWPDSCVYQVLQQDIMLYTILVILVVLIIIGFVFGRRLF